MQLLPGLRPLLPVLHGFVYCPFAPISATGYAAQERKSTVYLVWEMQASCLRAHAAGLHLRQLPLHAAVRPCLHLSVMASCLVIHHHASSKPKGLYYFIAVMAV